MNALTYPWYQVVRGDNLQQGDILDACPVFALPVDFTPADTGALLPWRERDVVVMTQSCDLARGREKVTEVLLCPIWSRSELTEGYLSTLKGLEDARRGNLPGFHVLAACDLPECPREARIVDFRRVYSLPVAFMRQQGVSADHRLRLLPPYREHLAQAFARFFMRIGLPTDIPPFR
jgi:hypothetical protein